MTSPPANSEERYPTATLTTYRKSMFAMGEFSLRLVEVVIALIYLFFLTEYANLRPDLAGLVFWTARSIDAITDPLMGYISDRTTSRFGRRRPYFLLGALPFGLFFCLLWLTPADDQLFKFLYYSSVQVGLSLAVTVLAVPYFSIIPDMVRDYHARGSLNVFRVGGGVFATFVAIWFEPLLHEATRIPNLFLLVTLLFAFLITLPWIGVFFVTREPTSTPPTTRSFLHTALTALRQRSFRRLVGFYLAGRVAVDFFAASLLYYLVHYFGRTQLFPVLLTFMFVGVFVTLPLIIRLSARMDKRRVAAIGNISWILSFGLVALLPSEAPAWLIVLAYSLGALGFATVDVMPWSMLGEVIDEAELNFRSRLDGVYSGLFLFLRKLAGAVAFLSIGMALSLTGYKSGDPESVEQSIWMIKLLATAAPICLLVVATVFCLQFPISKEYHARIQRLLSATTSGG